MSKAAKELTISQTAISHAVRSLEREFKLQLFYRDKKQMRLTDGGREFLVRARKVVEATKELNDYFQRGKPRSNHSISIGMTSLAQGVLSDALSKVLLSALIDLEGHYVFQIDTLFRLLDEGILDLAIIGTSELDSFQNYEQKVLGNCYTSLYTSEHNPLAKKRSVTVEQLADEPIMCFLEDASMMSDFTKIVAKFLPGLQLNNVKGSTTEMVSLIDFIRRTDGSTLIAHGAISETEGIREIPIEGALPFQMAALWRKKTALSKSTQKLLEQIKAQLANAS